MSSGIAIITTAHWSGDPRLNRHVTYLEQAGHTAVLTSFAASNRLGATVRAIAAILRSDKNVILLPDPEMFVVGSLAARMAGKRPIIDIHENYSEVAMTRTWVPDPVRPAVSRLADWNERLGRRAAWRTMVAAPELKRGGDVLVDNIPDPATLEFKEFEDSNRLVYIGDITDARGASEMVSTLAELGNEYELVLVGRVAAGVRELLEATSTRLGVASQIRFEGRQPHAVAWQVAGGALVGLNLLADVPAYREAVGTKLWEYMAVGLPPVVSDLPGQRRVIGEVDSSLVCDGPQAAAGAIANLADDKSRRQRLGREFREYVERRWSETRPDRVIQAIVEP